MENRVHDDQQDEVESEKELLAYLSRHGNTDAIITLLRKSFFSGRRHQMEPDPSWSSSMTGLSSSDLPPDPNTPEWAQN